MRTSRRKTGAGAWLMAVGTLILVLAACVPHSIAAGSDPATAALRPGTLWWGYQGAFSAITAAWSPDGQRIASGSWDTTVQVWQAS
jgi:WD40 repeat protein